jgi:hypothetical protein
VRSSIRYRSISSVNGSRRSGIFSQRLVGLFQFARVARVRTSAEFGDAEKVFGDSCRFDGTARNRVAGGQVHGIQGHLPDAALDREMFEGHVALELHIQTKGKPMDTVGSKCPNFFGRFGGDTQRPENSVDARSDVNFS